MKKSKVKLIDISKQEYLILGATLDEMYSITIDISLPFAFKR